MYLFFFIKKNNCWILLSSSPSKLISWKSTSTLSQLQTFNFFKSGNFEENLPEQNLLSWCKDSSKRVVSWGNKNKGVVSSSFSLATIASIPQEIIHRFWKVRSPLRSLSHTLVKLFRWDTYNSLNWMVAV